ncbi:MAG: PilZ domain-containing protein, partial [Planctomycetes bacterium]|nr:PilZ domain-containing protein [Planctomycetota bacterium]
MADTKPMVRPAAPAAVAAEGVPVAPAAADGQGTSPPPTLTKGQKAELELRGHFHGRRAGQRIQVPLDVELVCFERNVGARTVNLSRSGVLIEVRDTRAGGMTELVAYCEEMARLFAAGGTLDFACGVSRTVHVVRITAGGLGGRMVPLVACRFTEPLTPEDFAHMGIDPPPADHDVPDPVDADPSARPRVVRDVEVPGAKRKVPAIHELVRWAVELDATDIHVKAGSPPR